MRLLFTCICAALFVLATTGIAWAAPVCYQLPFSNPNLADGWGSTAGRTNPHRGVDFPQAANTPIPAVADGIVRVKTFTGCLGNVLVLEHADGMYSGYAHLIRTPSIAIGAKVTKGQIIAHVGTTGTCTTGNHLHLTMSASIDGYYAGTTVDPYKYIQGHKECSCDRSAGGLTFSCDGPNAGKKCVKIAEPADPDKWSDNHLCSDTDLGLAWSHAGPIAGKDCTKVDEPAETNAAAWADNFVCIAKDAPVRLAWSSAGPIAGQACVQFNETADKDSWHDNHLCVTPRTRFEGGGFTFSYAGPVTGKTCINVDEPSDSNEWKDNYLCTEADIGMKWSHAGPIAGMRCTNVADAAEHAAGDWADNFLCVPNDYPAKLTWASAGPIAGLECVRWYEPADLEGSWGDNHLCVTPPEPPVAPRAATTTTSDPPDEPRGDLASDEESSAGCNVAGARSSSSSLAYFACAISIALVVALRRSRRGLLVASVGFLVACGSASASPASDVTQSDDARTTETADATAMGRATARSAPARATS